MSGGGLAATLPDGFADAVAGPASGIEAALEGGEGAVGIRGDLTLGMFDIVGLPEAVLLILVERHFGKGQPAELPDEGDVLVDEVAEFGGLGAELVVVFGCEELEVGGFLGGEDEGFCVKAGFEGVH